MGELAPPPKAVMAGADPELGIHYASESSGSTPAAANPPRRWKKWQVYAVNGLALVAVLSAAVALAISEKINSDVSIPEPENLGIESVCGQQKALTSGTPGDCLQMSLEGPTVDLNYTTYVGTSRKSGINVFLGMRYAEPPLGELRWRAPIEPSGKIDGRVATAKAVGCSLGFYASLYGHRERPAI